MVRMVRDPDFSRDEYDYRDTDHVSEDDLIDVSGLTSLARRDKARKLKKASKTKEQLQAERLSREAYRKPAVKHVTGTQLC